MYTGFIYNDIFSKSLNIFGSSWSTNYNLSTILTNDALQLNPANKDMYDGTPYPIGLDPVWQVGLIIFFFLNKMNFKILNLYILAICK